MSSGRSVESIVEEYHREGYVVVPGILSAEEVKLLRADLEVAIEREKAFHGGTSYVDYGMVLVCCTHARSFVDILAHPGVMNVIEAVLSEGCIVYAYTSSSMPPGASNYSFRVHVDCPRRIPGYETNAGAIIALDDFTEENGATWILPGSHKRADKPTEGEFFAQAKRTLAPAGSVIFLHPLVWHSGGKNETQEWRHSITLNMCRPFMKQRLDIPKMMATSGVDLTGASDKALQKMGFYAQVPESLEEYYQPPEKRKYRQKVE